MDMLEERQGIEGSMRVINLVREKKIGGYISALTIPILWFITEKALSETEAKKVIRESIKGFSIAPLSSNVLNEAFKSEMKDFEDAIQLHSAIRARCEYLITRNKKDFISEDRPKILTPEEFLVTQ